MRIIIIIIIISTPIICAGVRFQKLASSSFYTGTSGNSNLLSLLFGEHFVLLSFWNPSRFTAGATEC
jgi:hypothetical protein